MYILSSERVRSVNLTALNPSQNGVNVTLPNVNNDTLIDNGNNQWDITVSDAQKGFHLETYLDDAWSFHPYQLSIISYTIYSTTSLNVTDLDLDVLISFSVNNTKYITVWPNLDNIHSNKIYPRCDESYPLATGDIKALVDQAHIDECNGTRAGNRDCVATGGVQTKMLPDNIPEHDIRHDNEWPITIILQNDPINDLLFVELSNPSWVESGFVQGCGYNESFPTGEGLQIYFALDDKPETIEIDQFSISLDYVPTSQPTKPPTTTFPTTKRPTTTLPTTAFPTTTLPTTKPPTTKLPTTAFPTTTLPTTKPPTTTLPTTKLPTTTLPTTTPNNLITTFVHVSSTAIEVIELTEANNESIIDELSSLYTFVSILFFSLFMLIGIIAFIDANKCHKNDVFRISAIIIFGLYSIDFISDIFFAATVYSQNNENMLWIFIASCFFLVIPLILNLLQLKQSLAKWMKDAENGWLIAAYIEDNSKILYIITMISGSGFASVKLVNSALFRLKFFDMGLKKHQMIEFQNKRLFSVVLMENVPQIVLQTIFAVMSGDVYTITIMALIFSVFSIILSIFEYSTTRSLIKYNDVDCCRYTIRFDVVSSHILKHRKTLKYQQTKITAYIAEILQVDCVLLEQLRARNINDGLQLLFRLKFDDGSKSSIIHEAIQDKIQNGSMAEAIKNVWRLFSVPVIKNLKVNQLQLSAAVSTHIQFNTINRLDSNDDSDPDNMSIL